MSLEADIAEIGIARAGAQCTEVRRVAAQIIQA